jgi:hypothetical protein
MKDDAHSPTTREERWSDRMLVLPEEYLVSKVSIHVTEEVLSLKEYMRNSFPPKIAVELGDLHSQSDRYIFTKISYSIGLTY